MESGTVELSVNSMPLPIKKLYSQKPGNKKRADLTTLLIQYQVL
jgi:hypothetical protein